MPFGYGTRTRRRASARPRRPRRVMRRKPSVAVKTRPRRVPVATKRDLMRLAKQVRRNTSQAMGDRQKSTQLIRWSGVQADRWVSVQTPHAIFHQGIQENSPLYGLRVQAGGPGQLDTLQSITPGTWVNCDLANVAGTAFDADALEVYDQQRQYASSLGVQSKYVHYSTTYTFNFTAVNCTGYYSIDLIMPRNANRPIRANTPNADETIYNVAQGLQGFIGLNPGSAVPYTVNPNYFHRKTVAKGYFNTAFDPNLAQLKTNPNFNVKVHVKNMPGKKLIVSSQNDPTSFDESPIAPGEVATGRQIWLIVSSSIEQSQTTANNHLKYSCTKLSRWADYLGASH